MVFYEIENCLKLWLKLIKILANAEKLAKKINGVSSGLVVACWVGMGSGLASGIGVGAWAHFQLNF